LSFSIIIPFLIGVIRYKRVLKSYHPILILFAIGLLNEILSVVFSFTIKNNAVNNNIYILIEFVLMIWQFYRWDILRSRRNTLSLILGITILVWVYDNLISHTIETFNSLYRVFYSSVLIFLSIDQTNRLIVNEKKNLFKNSIFLICIGILLFYTNKVLIETFYLFKLPVRHMFYDNLFFIIACVNVFVNLLYALAVLWIPTKEKFTLPS
jgi:hypothetical protein